MIDAAAVVGPRSATRRGADVTPRVDHGIKGRRLRWPLGDPLDPDFVYCGADCGVGNALFAASIQDRLSAQ